MEGELHIKTKPLFKILILIIIVALINEDGTIAYTSCDYVDIWDENIAKKVYEKVRKELKFNGENKCKIYYII